MKDDIKGQFGPEYPRELGRDVSRYRSATRRVGLRALSTDERRAYGEAVAAAIRSKQANELRRASGSTRAPRCASGTWHTTGREIHEAIRRSQINALLSCPSQERRARTAEQWRSMYEEAMAATRTALDCKASPQTEERKEVTFMNGKLSPAHQALVDQAEPIPEILRVENRKPTTKEEDARLRAELAASAKATGTSSKPINEADERAKAELLAQQEQTRKQKADARVAAVKAKQAEKPAEEVAFDRSLKRKQKQQEKRSKEQALRAMRERIAQQESTAKATTNQEKDMTTTQTVTPTERRGPGYARMKKNLGANAEKVRKTVVAEQAAARKVAKKPEAGKTAKKAASPAKAPAKKKEGESKTEIALKMMRKGATRKAIAEATSWPSINLKAIAERNKLKLKVKDGVYQVA